MAEEHKLQDVIEETIKSNGLQGLAEMSEQAERYLDMVTIMRALVNGKTKKEEALTQDERNLLSVAYKNVVGAKRSSWRSLDDQENLEETKELRDLYKKTVEKELQDICLEVLGMLDTLQKQNQTRLEGMTDQKDSKVDGEKQQWVDVNECQVFYLKMIGDYYRYLTEAFKSNNTYKEQCEDAYGKAKKIADAELTATHPTRLGLALNFSVCYYEILEKKKEACELAKAAFDQAIEKLDSLNDISYKDSTLIMQLLRDNLTIWQTDVKQPDEEAA